MPLLRSSGSQRAGEFYKYIGPADPGRLPAFPRFYTYTGPTDLGRLPAFPRFYKYDTGPLAGEAQTAWLAKRKPLRRQFAYNRSPTASSGRSGIFVEGSGTEATSSPIGSRVRVFRSVGPEYL